MAREEFTAVHVQGGNVPGGHRVLWDGVKEPFIAYSREAAQIPLFDTDVVVDIGAFVGTYAIRAARHPVRHVRAFEPTPRSFRLLAGTGLPNLEAIEAAVVGVPPITGRMPFYIGTGLGTSNGTRAGRGRTAIDVATVAYPVAVRDATIIKLDIEGGEYALPHTIPPTLRAIVIDFHPLPDQPWIEMARAIIQRYLDAGFHPIVEPTFNTSGSWRTLYATCNGAWARPSGNRPYERVHTGLVFGDLCCGCGAPIVKAYAKAVCEACWPLWLPRHRAGYVNARRLEVPV